MNATIFLDKENVVPRTEVKILKTDSGIIFTSICLYDENRGHVNIFINPHMAPYLLNTLTNQLNDAIVKYRANEKELTPVGD